MNQGLRYGCNIVRLVGVGTERDQWQRVTGQYFLEYASIIAREEPSEYVYRKKTRLWRSRTR